ncbi:hypothetical protein [Olleya sp. Bg11-27]|uniref:hypothetical protein n=1 Tax=Olleya sp. Bg11-27 TaxID=2058135 RepID=UPI000C30A540|nr:hypothetical protein [Olleya sp. Bg11-27]AUC75694.1 hypothetical protein CW732_08410 [Olleya sp. Bg11-27]
MKIPKTSDDFRNEFYSSIDSMDKIGDLRLRQFMDRLNTVSDEIITEGIVKVFEYKKRPEAEYTDQKYARKILEKLKPKSDIDLLVVLKSTIGNWNKSVEEFPFWMIENYGIESVKNKLTDLETQNLTVIELDKLKTIKWWLKI